VDGLTSRTPRLPGCNCDAAEQVQAWCHSLYMETGDVRVLSDMLKCSVSGTSDKGTEVFLAPYRKLPRVLAGTLHYDPTRARL